MLYLALCDDDKYFMDTLEQLINAFFENKSIPVQIDSHLDGKLLTERFINEDKPYDIVLLDIEMPGQNGKELARTLRRLDSYFHLIFISSHQNEVWNCFEYNISDFIPKHMIGDKLFKSLERALEAIYKKPAYYFFNVKDKRNNAITIKVLPDDIMYFECIQKKVYLNLKKECLYLNKDTWKEIEEKFQEENFVQPHRGYIVQVKYIAAIIKDQIVLDNGTLLPLSRRNKSKVEQMLLHIIE